MQTEQIVGGFDEVITAFVRLKKQAIAMIERRDEEIKPQLEKFRQIKEDLDSSKKRFDAELDPILVKLDQTKEQLKREWRENPKHVHKDGFIVKRRDLKRLNIIDKSLLINELGRLGKLSESIKTFDERLIMTLCDVNIIPGGAAAIYEKISISAAPIEKVVE